MNYNTVSVRRGSGNARETASIRNIHTMTSAALLAAVSFALAFLEFPVPLSPSFAKMDLSDFPAMGGCYDTRPLGRPGGGVD